MADAIDIAFGFDANYAPHAAAVIASVSRYSPQSRFRFMLLHEGVGRAVQTQIEALAANSEFVWIEVGEEDVPSFEARRHLTRSTLYRLGLENLAPADCARIIYLDADITVIGDMSELWREDLGGAAIGAAIDSYLCEKYPDAPFHQHWGLPQGDYFNAGILLIDLAQVRREKLFSKAMAFVAEHDHGLPFNDQDALNWTFWNQWRRLSVAWNIQRPQAVFWDAPKLPVDMQLGNLQPKIVHFTGPEKPWLASGYHPWAWIYWESLAHTPFFAQVARAQGVGRLARLRLWLRWLKRKPPAARLVGAAPLAALR
jgi:lipopolysaccharide biosynthesis glycosyltransferase